MLLCTGNMERRCQNMCAASFPLFLIILQLLFDCAVWRPKIRFVVCSINVPSELIVQIFAFGESNGTLLLVIRCAPVISKPLFRIGVKTKKKYVLRIFAPISYVRIGRWLGKRLLLHGIQANVVATLVQCGQVDSSLCFFCCYFAFYSFYAWFLFFWQIRKLHRQPSIYRCVCHRMMLLDYISIQEWKKRIVANRCVGVGLVPQLLIFYFVDHLKKFETFISVFCSLISPQCKEVTSAFLDISAMHASGILLPDLRMTNIGSANFCRARHCSGAAQRFSRSPASQHVHCHAANCERIQCSRYQKFPSMTELRKLWTYRLFLA